MKSYSNCSNAGEINIDLPDLFCSKLCLSPSNDHISNLKDYGDFAEENKQYDSSHSHSQHDHTQPNHVTSWSELQKRRLIESFHQADLTEMQVINKNIKVLNRRTIYRTFKAINENKVIQRRPGSRRNISISKSTFEIIKKCLEIDNGLSTFELSNKIFAEKGVKISSEAIRRYLVSQNYKYEKLKVLTIYLSDLLKISVLILQKITWVENQLILFLQTKKLSMEVQLEIEDGLLQTKAMISLR